MSSIEPPGKPPPNLPEDQTQKTPPEGFKIDYSKLSDFEKKLIKEYNFSEKEAKKFMENMEQAVVAEMKRGFKKMGQSIKKMFKDED